MEGKEQPGYAILAHVRGTPDANAVKMDRHLTWIQANERLRDRYALGDLDGDERVFAVTIQALKDGRRGYRVMEHLNNGTFETWEYWVEKDTRELKAKKQSTPGR